MDAGTTLSPPIVARPLYRSSGKPDTKAGNPGLFRSALINGPSRLTDVFERLSCSPYRYDFSHASAGIQGGRVPCDDGGAWEMWNVYGQAYIVISDCTYRQPRIETVVSERFVEFHYNLAGSVTASLDCHQHNGKVGNLDLVICSLGKAAQYDIRCEPGRRRSVAVYVTPRYFAELIDAANPHTRKLCDELTSITAGQIYFQRIAIGLSHALLVKQLVDNPFHDRRRPVFAQSKVNELLCHSIDIWAEQLGEHPGKCMLSPRDVRLLHDARHIILENFAQPPTIDQLAKQIGVNTTKLTSGFRTLFGCTIHEYSLQTRMDHALRLLLEQQLSVSQTAEQVGYQHPSNFSVAFQNHFGFPPRNAHRIAETA